MTAKPNLIYSTSHSVDQIWEQELVFSGLGNSALKAPETQCGHGNLVARGSIVLQEFLKWEAQRLRQLFHVAHFGKSDASFSW